MSEATKRNLTKAVQFKKVSVRRASPTPGYEAWCTILYRPEGEVFIAAPTLDKLEEHWDLVSKFPLKRDMANHVVILEQTPEDVPPEEVASA